MPVRGIERMFDLNRIEGESEFYKMLLYSPFGFLVLFIRLVVLIVTWPFLAFLPKASEIRSLLLKVVSLVFGVCVKKDTQHQDNEAKLMVCNHVSILDHIAVESVLSCKQVNICSHFCCEWDFPTFFGGRNHDDDADWRNHMILLHFYLGASDVPALVFPECTTTNGKYGLLKFNAYPFDITSIVQPVVIRLVETSFIKVSPSVIGSSNWCDLFWLLFIPYTVFSVRVLPSMSKIHTESAENFSKRVQNAMANSLNLVSTEYTSTDKVEFEKHPVIPSNANPGRSPAQYHSPEIIIMANQVKEALPSVPLSVILQDLEMTRNVDDTVSRIVEGIVAFVPEDNSCESSSSSDSNEGPSFNTAAEEFGKTPQSRMQSYQERKAALIQAAKMRYLRKHNLL